MTDPVKTPVAIVGVGAVLPDAPEAARRLKRTLQSVFETHYSFDLELLKKQNLGKAIKEIERFNGVSPFAVSYVTQNALGGHSIPVNEGVFSALRVLGVISQAEAARRRVPGMERAISKSRGVEFASLLHQLGVDYATTPFSPRVRSIVLEISPDAKDRLPKRGAKKEDAETARPGKSQTKTAKSSETTAKESTEPRDAEAGRQKKCDVPAHKSVPP